MFFFFNKILFKHLWFYGNIVFHKNINIFYSFRGYFSSFWFFCLAYFHKMMFNNKYRDCPILDTITFMRTKKQGLTNIKVQINVPKPVLDQIDQLINKLFMSRTQWFLQLALDELKRESKDEKKIIDIDI